MTISDERVCILGASRGLGAAFTRKYALHFSQASLLLIARKAHLLENLSKSLGAAAETAVFDFSKQDDQLQTLERIQQFNPTRILYFAGGGPYGDFESKEWKDHIWSWEVTFLFAARLLHHVLKNSESVRQITFIGSAIAEDGADVKASSYCSAKHALKGLIRSVIAEKPRIDVRLYSPGYMNTEMLPSHAWPRQHPEKILEPEAVAQDLLAWLFMNDGPSLRVYR